MSTSPSSSSSPKAVSGEARQLTPVSKVKAALAAIDSDSDDDIARNEIATRRRRSALATISGNARGTISVFPKGIEKIGSEQEDESHGKIIVPRGRLAGNLRARTTDRQSSASDEDVSGTENAYTRIRKRLLKGATKPQEEHSGDGTTHRRRTAATASRVTSPTALSLEDGSSPSAGSLPGFPTDLSPALASPSQLDDASRVLPTRQPTEEPCLDKPLANNRFLELVAKKRAEREAKEVEEARKRDKNSMAGGEFEKTVLRAASPSDETSDDALAEKHLTQSSRPTRKASKKALEEMNRETQRMNRNMQLAHQAKTKKKISKDSFFARFNFRTSTASTETITEHPSSSTMPSSAPQSDGEGARPEDSPPTSPAEIVDQPLGKSILGSTTIIPQTEAFAISTKYPLNQGDDDLPGMADLLKQPLRLDKGKAKAVDSPSPSSPVDKKKKRFEFKQRPVRISLPNVPSKVGSVDLDSASDSDEPLNNKTMDPISKKSKLDAFRRLPANKLHEGRSLLTLRALAHLNDSDQIRGRKSSTNIVDMQMSLQKRARLQALEERKAKIDDLKARGILVQSAEEREKDQAEVENLLEKARKQAEELQQKEKRAARKQSIANGDTGTLVTSDEDDEDYEDGDDGDADVELSGSDEGGEDEQSGAHEQGSDGGESEDAEDLGLGGEERAHNDFHDGQAEEGHEKPEATHSDEDLEDEPWKPQLSRPRRNKISIEDEEDEDEGAEDTTEAPTTNISARTEPRLLAINLPQLPLIPREANTDPQPLGMTQAFAATMAETQEEAAGDADEEQDSMNVFQPPPEPDLPLFFAENSQAAVQDSQTGRMDVQDTAASHRIDLHFSQSQLQPDALGPRELQRESTELTEIPDPTQDAGFALSSPVPERFVSARPSTVDTVVIPPLDNQQSPVVRTRGRLIRGRPNHDQMEREDTPDESMRLPSNAFQAMWEGRKKKAEEAAFDKKRSDAKNMVEEQAMESEDEYAGLGGASDDESGGEEDQDVKEMMDHGDVAVDEGQLAAFYANKERASDEKAVERLFKDINNGGLRRKRGADFDLSDSDDGGEARRRRKQREFAKMRKALLADEKVGQIAEDPKKLAFLKAIEDREDDEGLDFLEKPAEDSFRVEMDTQDDGLADSHPQQPSLQATQEDSSNKQQRALQETTPNMRPPPAARRTAAGSTTRKPSTLAEIRESVSFLIETPGAMNNAPDPSSSASEAEDNDDDDHHHHHHHPRRTASNPIVDRLLLKRASTATSTSSSTSRSRLAFYDPNSSTTNITTTTTTSDGFKVPSLLRRATTTNLMSGESRSSGGGVDKNGISTYAATERAAGGGGGSEERIGFKRGGDRKKCSVNYFAREMDKQGVVEGVEPRRREEREKRARERRGRGVLLSLGGLGRGGGGFD